MMLTLSHDDLAAVLGGQSSTTVTFPGGSAGTAQSDQERCVQNAVGLAYQQYPRGLLTDVNASARDQAIRHNVDTMCIGPSGGGGGGFQ